MFTGDESGVGLTALMAYASSFYANLNPDKLILFHFSRASDKSTLYYEFMRRAIQTIQSFFNIEQSVPTEKDEIVADFPGWIQMASERGGMLLFIDGLDQMDNVDGAHQLDWIPSRLPANVRVVLSSSSQLPAVRNSSTRWSELLSVGLLTPEEKSRMLDKLLSSKSKTLSPGQRHRILTSDECRLPLYLKALLDELTVEGVFETLGQTIDTYLRAKDPAELYKLIVDRWCRDFGEDFVRSTLAMICVSRQGISEYELLEVLKCSHADFNRLFMPLKDSLTNRNGLLCLSNQLIGQVVVSDLLASKTRRLLAQYFWAQQQKTPVNQDLSSRIVAELPYQLRKLHDWEWFFQCLSDMRMFSALYTDEFMYELIAYWREIEEAHKLVPMQQSKMTGPFAYLNGLVHAAGGDLVLASLRLATDGYISSGPSSRDLANKYFKMGEFMREIAKYPASSEFYSLGINLQEALVSDIKDRDIALQDVNSDGESIIEELALSYDGMAFLYKTISKYADAAVYSVRAIEMLESVPITKSVAYSFISALCNYSQILGKQVKLEECETVARRAVAIAKANLPPYDPEVARAVNCLSIALKKLKRFSDAEPLALESLKLREKVCGPNHTFVSYSLMNVGNIYAKLKRFSDAVAAYERMYRITCDFHGANHPQGCQAKYSLGKLYLKFGHRAQAEASLNAALKIALEVYGDDHALTKKIYMQILGMVGYQESESLLLASIQSTLVRFIDIGLTTNTLVRTEHGLFIPARVDVKERESENNFTLREKPRVEIYPPNYFARLAALEEAKTRGINRAIVMDEPFESSDEDAKEEAAFESSDEDMGFSLFD
jgi:nephrocystin-3